MVPIAVNAKFFGLYWKSLMNKEIDMDTDVLKLLLTTSTFTPNQDTHQYKSSVTNEVSGTGYTAGGATVGPIAVAYDTATNVLSFDGADVSWTSTTLNGANSPRWAILYDSTPATDATRPLIGYVDLDGDTPITNGTLSITWNASGIGYVTVA